MAIITRRYTVHVDLRIDEYDHSEIGCLAIALRDHATMMRVNWESPEHAPTREGLDAHGSVEQVPGQTVEWHLRILPEPVDPAAPVAHV